MARDASGNYTLPAGNPVAGGTTITATWGNTTMLDVGTELTASLDRNGQGGMLAGLKGFAGTVSLPAFTFTSEVSSGMYYVGTGDFRMSVLGTTTTKWIDDTSTPAGSQKPFLIWDGTSWEAPLTSAGTVTSIDVSGGTTGLTTTGGPVTTSGVITFAGTLAVTNGGTGLTAFGTANQVLAVNGGGTALEYQSVTTGTVTSVNVSGGTTGLTTAGGPVTSSGTFTLAGTLAATSGGTGITSVGASGQVLTSNGSAWVSQAPAGSTIGTLTQTFIVGQTVTISLTGPAILAPVVTVTKEIPQTGVTNNTWDVSSTAENYTRLDSAPATTLSWMGFDISSASFVDSFSVSGQDTAPTGVTFNTDGTKMFVTGNTGNDVNEYTLSTAYDVSTSTFVDSFSVSAQQAAPMSVAFNTDGTKMYIVGETEDTVAQYALTTGFDVSTASFTQSFDISGQETEAESITFNPDGTKMFVTGDTGNDINEYTLSTGFDVSTASFVDSFSFATQSTQPKGAAFNTSGTELFMLARDTASVYKYTLTTAFDVSTASYASVSFDVSAQEGSCQGLAFDTTGTKMFVVGDTGDAVHEYTLDAAVLTLGTGSFAAADVGKTIEANSGVFVLTATDGSNVETTAPTSYAQVASGSWEMYGVVYNTVDGDLELSGVSINGFDVSLSSFVDGFSVASQETSPKGVAFNTDGTKMFVVGDAGVNEYTLSAGFDVSTSTYLQNFSVSAQESSPEDIAFNTDGTKMFILGSNGNDVNEYALSTGFNVSTAVYDSVFSVSAQDTDPSGLTFSADGTYMFMSGNTGNSVYKYTLSTGFDVSTASYTNAYSVNAQESNPQGVAFNTDGTKMFVCGTVGDDVNEYTVSTAYDPSTSATFVDSFSVSAQDGFPMGLAFNADGTKMFVVGAANNTIFEYTVGTTAAPSGYNPVHTTNSIDSTYWTDINSMTADQAAGDGNVYYAISTDDRTTWSVIKDVGGERDIVKNNGGTWQYNSNGTYGSETWTAGATNTELATLAQAMEGASVAVPYDLANSTEVTFTSDPSVGGLETFILSADGTRGYWLTTSDLVYQADLPSAFNGSSGSWGSTTSFSVTSQETVPKGIRFKSDGLKMYILGYNSDSIFQYSLSTAWDVTSASYDSVSFSVSSQSTTPAGLSFSENGLYVYINDLSSLIVYQYNLSTAWDISSASYSGNSITISSPSGLTYIDVVDSGTKMFASFSTSIQKYSLSSAYDVSTATVTADSISLGFNGKSVQVLDSGGYMATTDGSTSGYLQDINTSTTYTNQMDKTQLDAVTDPNHIALGTDLDLSIILNMTSGTTVPSSNGVAIDYDANILNEGAILGTDYDFDAPTTTKVRITALAANNLKVRVL